jgi:glycine cleavage system pyridoxal-binding protein P
MKANFEKAWNKFDINSDGFIRAEETHTFMRSLMGKLNKFALAPGSLSDISSGADTTAMAAAHAEEVKPKPVVKKPVVAKKVEVLAESEETGEAKTEDKAIEAAVSAAAEDQEVDAALIDIGLDD